MRSLLPKLTALALVGFVLAALAVPSAPAQIYPPIPPPTATPTAVPTVTPTATAVPAVAQPVDCASLGAPSIAVVGTNLVITFPQGTLTCIIRVVVEINPVLYDGPPPVGGTLTLPIPALVGDDFSATVTVTSTFGQELSDAVSIAPAVLEAARTNFGASGLPTTAGVPAAVPVPAASQNLAFTGGNVNLPIAVGAVLVCAGGLALLAARKRDEG